MKDQEIKVEKRDISTLKEWDKNPRTINRKDFDRLKKQLTELGQYKPLLITPDGTVIGGNMRLKALRDMKINSIWVSVIETKDETELLKYALSDNDRAGYYDDNLIANMMPNYNIEWSDYAIDFEPPESLGDMLKRFGVPDDEDHLTLAEQFVVPPFTIFDARQGYWQARKTSWVNLGIESEVGRADDLVFNVSSQPISTYKKKEELEAKEGRKIPWEELREKYPELIKQKGTSIFDPVLCEIMYRWFCVDGGLIIDPFSGGSVRGIVASKLGYQYLGIDLSEKQINENIKQAGTLNLKPEWLVGDSLNIDEIAKGKEADMIFSCPPYYDLEKYGDDPNDLSNKQTYQEFIKTYREIIKKSLALLKDDRFAVFVVGDIRDKEGVYRNFVSDTISAFVDAGVKLYNEGILITSYGSLIIRIKQQFTKYRKLGKAHQNVLIFYKGDLKKIKENFKEIDIGKIEEFAEEESWQVEK